MIRPKDREHLDFELWEKEKLENPQFKAEYDRLQPEFALIEAVLKARREKGLTQKEIAQKIGTKQSVISRLEKGRANPTLAFLKKLACAFSSRLEIRFVQ
jgi:ribosome-binding protein aMBF1 (putative translation factor)